MGGRSKGLLIEAETATLPPGACRSILYTYHPFQLQATRNVLMDVNVYSMPIKGYMIELLRECGVG